MIVIIIVNVFGKDSPYIYINPSFSAVLNALQLFQMVIIHLLGFALIKKTNRNF
jgi:hypothetical protein